jgi:hypothetical protein
MLRLIVAAVLTIGTFSSQDLPAVTESHGGFGFPNVAGTEIIVLHDIPHGTELRTAICGGRSLSVRFVRHQAVTGARPDRESPRQFDRLEGTVFQFLAPGARPEDTCFVAADGLLEDAELLRVDQFSTPAECTRTERRRFAALRERPIKACWSIAAVRPQGLIGVVEYARVGRDALASLIVMSKEREISIDFPAEYRGEGEDTWRAGDVGEFSPDGFRVPFIIRRSGTYFVAVDWGAEEGNSLSLYASERQTPARQLIHDYWYRAPR